MLKVVYFILNRRFVPREPTGPYLYGVVQHVSAGSHALERQGIEVKYILYLRDEESIVPEIYDDTAFGRKAITVKFNFRMDHCTVKNEVNRAISQISDNHFRSPQEVIYLQTMTMLCFMPASAKIFVTNHGPFVDDVERRIGKSLGQKAFNWDHDKYEKLRELQRLGISEAKNRNDVYFYEISKIQTEYLEYIGVSNQKIYRISPPLFSETKASNVDYKSCAEATAILSTASEGKVALSVVSRLDAFKRMELFVAGSVEAIKLGYITGFILIGGEDIDPARERLREMVPKEMRNRSLFLSRVSHSFIIDWLFPWAADNAYFVCSSRFDLTPYTVLHAALFSVPVVTPRSSNVGCNEYLSDDQQYDENPISLANILKWASTREAKEVFQKCFHRISNMIGEKQFVEPFINHDASP